jgi:glycosyltransferase involved in cell wall biosynthesis
MELKAPVRISNNTYDKRLILDSVNSSISLIRDSPYNYPQNRRWGWRSRMFPPVSDYPTLLQRYLQTETLFPHSVDPERGDIAFVVPFGSYGGAEKVSYAAALQLRRRGFSTHLFVVGGKGYKLFPEYSRAFSTINLIGDENPLVWGGSQCGRAMDFASREDKNVGLLLGLLASMDVVVNCQSAPLNAVIGDLKSLGIMTISYIHLFDFSPLQREVGHPFLGLLFEYAYDLFVVCSDNLRRRLHGLGIPSEKLLTVRNAPSFSITSAQSERLRAARNDPGEGLKVLFIGRMDAQKGLERIVGIVHASVAAGYNFDFRFIGSTVVEEDLPVHMRDALHSANVHFERPVFAADDLAAAFGAADVLILPSRWEGAPLVILEAQQCGCIPVATNVGAVSELIEHGKDGVLVPDADDHKVVAYFISALSTLQHDRSLRREIALAAMDRIEGISWKNSFHTLIQIIERRISTCTMYQPQNTDKEETDGTNNDDRNVYCS